MKKAKNTCYKMMVIIVLTGIIFAILGALLTGQYIKFPLGVAAGCFVAGGLLYHMFKCASTIIGLPYKRAKAFGRNMSVLRIALMGVALLVAFYYKEYINPWGVLLGILTLKISAYLHGFIKIDFDHKGDELQK